MSEDPKELKALFLDQQTRLEDNKFFYNKRHKEAFKLFCEGKKVPEIAVAVKADESEIVGWMSAPAFLRRVQTYLVFADIRKAVFQIEELETLKEAVAERKIATDKSRYYPDVPTDKLMAEYHKLLLDNGVRKNLSPELAAIIVAMLQQGKRGRPKDTAKEELKEVNEEFGVEEPDFDIEPELEQPNEKQEVDFPVDQGDGDPDEQVEGAGVQQPSIPLGLPS